MEKLMEISHVGYSYHTMQGETPALSNINFTVHKGDFLAIVGPSGCGNGMVLQRKQFIRMIIRNRRLCLAWLPCIFLRMHFYDRQPLVFVHSCPINGCHK